MNIFLSVFLFIVSSIAFAQNKVTWSTAFSIESNEVIITANIDDTWHLYALELSTEDGPIPTEFQFEANENVELIGALVQPSPKISFDENFGSDLEYFEGEVTFRQQVKLINSTKLVGSVYYMVCDDHTCLPPIEVPFTVELNN